MSLFRNVIFPLLRVAGDEMTWDDNLESLYDEKCFASQCPKQSILKMKNILNSQRATQEIKQYTTCRVEKLVESVVSQNISYPSICRTLSCLGTAFQ